MLKHISAEELLNAKEFVREPIDNICRDIDKINYKKIILSGGRGTGKTTVLHNLEKRGIGRENQCIFTAFDLGFIHEIDEIFTESFFNHYYELLVVKKMLNYINKYYSFTYQNNFMQLEESVNSLINETTNYINKAKYYDDMKLSKYLQTGEISIEVLKKIKKQLKINSLSLAIDRFDWLNGVSELTQNILSKYFEIFDKVIITTDDNQVNINSYFERLLENKYIIYNIYPSKDKLVIKEIIKRRIEQYNNDKNTGFDVKLITDGMYQFLIGKSLSNIDVILDSIGDLIDEWYFKDGNIDLYKQINDSLEKQLDKTRQLRKMSRTPKLYL